MHQYLISQVHLRIKLEQFQMGSYWTHRFPIGHVPIDCPPLTVLWGVHWPKEVHLPSFVYQYSRHQCSINCVCVFGGPLAKLGSSAKLCVLVDLPGDLPIWALMVNIQNCHSDQLVHLQGGTSARTSAKISFNNNITHYIWQIWALIVEVCNYHVGVFWGVSGVFWECWDVEGITSDMDIQCWVFTNLIIQKYKEIPTFTWRIQHGCQIHPIIYIPCCIWGIHWPK